MNNISCKNPFVLDPNKTFYFFAQVNQRKPISRIVTDSYRHTYCTGQYMKSNWGEDPKDLNNFSDPDQNLFLCIRKQAVLFGLTWNMHLSLHKCCKSPGKG